MYHSYAEWTADLNACPPNDQKAFIVKTLKPKDHLHIFGKLFFPEIIKGLNEVPECHIDLINELASPEDGAIIFPRGHAKSTWCKIDLIHDIVYGLEDVILWIGATQREAGFHFESIKAQLESNIDLRIAYGNVVPSEKDKGRKWTAAHLETINGVNALARGRLKGRGINIKNKRPTKIIIDDVEDDDLVKNPDQRIKLNHWLYYVIFPGKDKERGRVKMIGTVLHERAEVLEFYNNYGGIFRKAIEDGKPIWPEQYSLEELHKIRDGYTKPDGSIARGIGTRAFEQEYQNSPNSDEMAKIKPSWIDEGLYTLQLPGKKNKVITIDPQSGEKNSADEYAVTCLAWYPKDVHRYAVEQRAGRGSQLEQAKEVARMWLRHKEEVLAVGIEKVLNQTAVYQLLMDWKARKLDFNSRETSPGEAIDERDRNMPIRAIDPRGRDKVARLETHEPAFERGEIHLRPEMGELRTQLMFLGQKTIKHDDRADSLIMALDLSYSVVGRSTLSTKSDKDYNIAITGNPDKQKF